jgi:carbonic anhydrase
VQPRDNLELEEFFGSLDLVRSPKAKHFISNPLNLKNLVEPSLEGTFFRYNGSLTTPGCQESVTWTLFETPIGVSLRQVCSSSTLSHIPSNLKS